MSATLSPRRATLLLALLTFLNVLNFADRYLLISFANTVIADLSLTNFQFALLTGFAFTAFYTLAGLFMGLLADRLHRPRLMAAGLLVWSALTALTGTARNFFQVASARALIGIGEATLTPAAISMLSDAYPASRRGFASAIFYLGIPIGTGASFILASSVGAQIGWRNMFFIMGLLGILASAILLLVGDLKRGAQDKPTNEKSQTTASLGELKTALLASPAALYTLAGAVCVVFAQGALVLDQVWFVKERAFGIAEAQKFSGGLFLLGGVLGSFIGGWGSDALAKRYPGGRLLFLAIVYALATPIALLYRYLPPHTAMFTSCAFAGSLAAMMIFGPALATLQELLPLRIRSTGVAFFILCVSILGNAPGSAMAGWLGDYFAAQAVVDPLSRAIFMTMLPALAAAPLFYMAYRSYVIDATGEIGPTAIQ